MPRVSTFYGIVIWTYHEDHNPPHFHASYGEHWAVYQIDGTALIAGSLPARARRMVEEWASQHTRRDGLVRDVDLTRLGERGGVFVPLRDPDYFAQVRVDSEAGTVVWPNGVDLDPLVLQGDYEPVEPNPQSA